MEVEIDAKSVVGECLRRGVLINATSERVLRFIPPLIVTERDIDRLIDVLSHVFNRHAIESPGH
jgi:acetylornithine aminotransferase